MIIESLIITPIELEIKLKAKRLNKSEKEKPTKVFLTIRFFQG